MTEKTVKNIDRDFSEWHGGISHYGFWSISIEDDAWETALDSARHLMADFLLEGYARTPHITLFACGLLDEKHFSSPIFQAQKQYLNEMQISPFSIYLDKVKSFSTCPFLSINFNTDSIYKIRRVLNKVSKEDRAAEFEPHLTLGLYRDTFSLAKIYQQLDKIKIPDLEPIVVNRIDFCRYRTTEIQGELEIIDSINLT